MFLHLLHTETNLLLFLTVGITFIVILFTFFFNLSAKRKCKIYFSNKMYLHLFSELQTPALKCHILRILEYQSSVYVVVL